MIKKLLLLTLMCITTSINAQVSTKDVYATKAAIEKATGKQFNLRFNMENAEVNAFANVEANTIMVTGSMLIFLQSQAELVWLLGHEVGHLKLGHIGSECTPDNYKRQQQEELDADLYGYIVAKSLGYQLEDVLEYHYRALESLGEPHEKACHPKWSDRIKLLRGM